jgi:hypothetical protein
MPLRTGDRADDEPDHERDSKDPHRNLPINRTIAMTARGGERQGCPLAMSAPSATSGSPP